MDYGTVHALNSFIFIQIGVQCDHFNPSGVSGHARMNGKSDAPCLIVRANRMNENKKFPLPHIISTNFTFLPLCNHSKKGFLFFFFLFICLDLNKREKHKTKKILCVCRRRQREEWTHRSINRGPGKRKKFTGRDPHDERSSSTTYDP